MESTYPQLYADRQCTVTFLTHPAPHLIDDTPSPIFKRIQNRIALLTDELITWFPGHPGFEEMKVSLGIFSSPNKVKQFDRP